MRVSWTASGWERSRGVRQIGNGEGANGSSDAQGARRLRQCGDCWELKAWQRASMTSLWVYPEPWFFSSILNATRQEKVGFLNFTLFCSVNQWKLWRPVLQVLGIPLLFSHYIKSFMRCYCELSSTNSDYLQMMSNLFCPNLPQCLLNRLLELFPCGDWLHAVHSTYNRYGIFDTDFLE